MLREEVYMLIDGERDYQGLAWSTSDKLTVGEELLLLEEFVQRARAVWSEEPAPETGAMNLFRIIAALAVRALENHGANPREI